MFVSRRSLSSHCYCLVLCLPAVSLQQEGTLFDLKERREKEENLEQVSH